MFIRIVHVNVEKADHLAHPKVVGIGQLVTGVLFSQAWNMLAVTPSTKLLSGGYLEAMDYFQS